MRQQRSMSQMKEQDKTQEEQLSDMEMDNLPGKEFRVMTDLGKRMEAQSEKIQEIFNKARRYKEQTIE